MDMAFLVQMRQSNKCGSVRNDEIINLHLGSGAGPWVSIPYLLQDTSHICWFHPPKTINQEKTKNPEMRSNFQQILSYCLDLRTQNPGTKTINPLRLPYLKRYFISTVKYFLEQILIALVRNLLNILLIAPGGIKNVA